MGRNILINLESVINIVETYGQDVDQSLAAIAGPYEEQLRTSHYHVPAERKRLLLKEN